MTEALMARLDAAKLPKHIAFIMDGNGRWAQRQGKERIWGHMAGVDSLKSVIAMARKVGISYLTFYAFSTENWQRPEAEVQGLMALLTATMKDETNLFYEYEVRLRVMGDIAAFPQAAQDEMSALVEKTRKHDKITVLMALNYSAKWELLRAVNQIIADGVPAPVDERTFRRYLATGDMPDPELLVRTGGEYRISNFLLYQIAYSELYFTPVFWPDFKGVHLLEAILSYQKRERRFGKTGAQIQP